MVDTNAKISVDVVMQVGKREDAITVKSDTVQVATSDTQIGDVIQEKKITAVPLNGRSYTDLLALQPGVAPATSLDFSDSAGRRYQCAFAIRRS